LAEASVPYEGAARARVPRSAMEGMMLPGSTYLTVTRRNIAGRCHIAALVALVALVAIAPLLSTRARAQNSLAELVAKPLSLTEMALGPASSPVTVVYFMSLTCAECVLESDDLLTLKSKYVDAGKVRLVIREYPTDVRAVAASMLARCSAADDAAKYFETIELLFGQWSDLMASPLDTLRRIGKQAGMSQQAIESCLNDQSQLNKITADKKFAVEVLHVDRAPTFFINGEKTSSINFVQLDKTIESSLKR
jgi:protein-disulfide isomerase